MERIYITPEIEKLSVDFLKKLKTKPSKRFKLPTERLKMLCSFLECKGKRFEKYALYVKEIIDRYDEIIALTPESFKSYTASHFNMLDENRLKLKIKYNKKRKAFYEHVVDAMRYQWVRDEVYLTFGLKLGIKACAYCNAQYATTVLEGKSFAAYDLDHSMPKSRYPFLSTSFFNLIPVCAHCNRVKSDKKLSFNLYTSNKGELRPLRFSLDPKSVIHYMLTHEDHGLDIRLKANYPLEEAEIMKFVGELGIDALYNAHKDEAANVIWKAKIYNKSFREQLKETFKRMGLREGHDIDNVVLGFDMRKGKVHTKPLTLLGQDIFNEYGEK